MRPVRRIQLILAAAVACAAPLSAALAAPGVGDKAPDFLLAGSDGKQYTLAQFAGKEAVVLAWFPKAFTPGWRAELQALRDSAAQLGEYEASVFMVSLDDPEKNRAFADSLEAKLTLLSDTEGIVAKEYGVSSFGGLYARRWTFYIDKAGMIRHIDKDVSVETAGQDIARTLGELGIPKR